MMKSLSISGLLLLLITGSGCRTTPVAAGGTVNGASPASASHEAGFETGKRLLESGYNLEATKQFAYLRDHARTAEERDRAAIGLSMALQDSGNSGAALGALEPLPVLPKTATEARKCVLAGELYLHQQNLEVAQVWLARGLEVEPDSHKSYRASAFFNLGKAMLGNEELEDAEAAFEMAKEIFSANGDVMNVEECDGILEDIRTSLL